MDPAPAALRRLQDIQHS